MKIYTGESVYDAALSRIRRLYREFDNVMVTFSGGKDSTVVLNLTLQVAEELGRLPVPVSFIDQESEWEATVEYTRIVMSDPRVKPYWYQVPMQESNATSDTDEWLECWQEGGPWMREKEPNSIHENRLGTKSFHDIFPAVCRDVFGDEPVAMIGGVRAEESPSRRLGMTADATFKEITWGKVHNLKRHQYSFYPIYDWTIADVWKYIHDGEFPYNKIYDAMYRYGVPIRQMRVSSLHHDLAVKSLMTVQELEPETWQRLTARLSHVNIANHLSSTLEAPKELPPMFGSWKEYRDHLVENLISEESKREKYRAMFRRYESGYLASELPDVHYVEVKAIFVNDWFGTTLSRYIASHPPSGRTLRRSKYKGAQASGVSHG